MGTAICYTDSLPVTKFGLVCTLLHSVASCVSPVYVFVHALNVASYSSFISLALDL